MPKPNLFLLSLIFLLLIPFLSLAEESITISTYYPSPYGVYREMRAKRIAIGDTYFDGGEMPWEAEDGDGNPIDLNADLVVEGNVGIGTTSPTGPLDVYGTGAAKGLTVDTSGNVGIGTTSPSTKLHVNGDTKLNGTLTNALLPAFLARPSAMQSDIPVNTATTVLFGTEVFDQANNFASSTFTAPVTGRYMLSYSIYITSIDSAAAVYSVDIITSNRMYPSGYDPRGFASDLANGMTFTASVLADMDAGDTAYVMVEQTYGTQQADIEAGSWFSGYLVC
ncbi:MAG: hypothetical protein PHO03_05820 [Candidatus Omnitrophica bacterium]|nr:hypothetical protein [Candidatus Omnitrophota bacterium]